MPTALGNLPGATQSFANGINNSGQVVGSTNSGMNSNYVATIWNGTAPTSLGTLPGGVSSNANSINSAGAGGGLQL